MALGAQFPSNAQRCINALMKTISRKNQAPTNGLGLWASLKQKENQATEKWPHLPGCFYIAFCYGIDVWHRLCIYSSYIYRKTSSLHSVFFLFTQLSALVSFILCSAALWMQETMPNHLTNLNWKFTSNFCLVSPHIGPTAWLEFSSLLPPKFIACDDLWILMQGLVRRKLHFPCRKMFLSVTADRSKT